MAQKQQTRSMRLVGLLYLVEGFLRMNALESHTVFFGKFLFARSAYTCQLVLTTLSLFAAIAIFRRRSQGRAVGMGLSLLCVLNALLIYAIPESRNILVQFGTQMGLDAQAALLHMGAPYLVRGILHGMSLAWLMRHASLFGRQPARFKRLPTS